MAEPAAEQIMQAIVVHMQSLTASIPGLVIEEGENPDFGVSRLIHVAQGLEVPISEDEFGTEHARCLLDIEITVGATIGIGEKLRTVLNGMLALVKDTLRADHTLGGLCALRWVSTTYGDPREDDGLPRMNIAVSAWIADYVHAYDDSTQIFPV